MLQPFLDDVERDYTKELDRIKSALEGFNARGGVKTSQIVKKLSGLYECRVCGYEAGNRPEKHL